MKKIYTNIFLSLWIDCISNLMQFECHLIFHQISSKLYNDFKGLNLMVFDKISNDTQTTSNLKHN
jgi:hypothetical protein